MAELFWRKDWVVQTSWKEKEGDTGWTAVKVKEETGGSLRSVMVISLNVWVNFFQYVTKR